MTHTPASDRAHQGDGVMGDWTKGPWAWFGNAKNKEVYLATENRGRRCVMGFRRWGMAGAQPMFQPGGHGLVPADKLFTFAVGDRNVRGTAEAHENSSVYRLDINGIDCADARLIAAAPDLVEALLAMISAFADEAEGNDLMSEALCIADAAIARATGAA